MGINTSLIIQDNLCIINRKGDIFISDLWRECSVKLRQSDLGIGQNIKRLRKQAGYSQSDMVVKLQLLGIDISYDVYKKIEQNKYNIRVRELVAIKYILGISYNEFFYGLRIDEGCS